MDPIEIAVVWECPTCGTQLAQLAWASRNTLPTCYGSEEDEHNPAEMEQKTPERWGTPSET